MTGWLLIAAGAVLALPQVFTATPAQAVFWLGVLLALAGAVAVVDSRQDA